jgi:hypothetical protein
MVQEHAGNLEVFASDYLNQQKRMLLDLTQADIQAYRDLRKGEINRVSFKRFVWFLRDSGRIGMMQSVCSIFSNKNSNFLNSAILTMADAR